LFRSRLSRILSLAVASLSFGTHMVVHVQTGAANERYEVAQSCFAGTDYAHISISALTVLVERYVAAMRGQGATDKQIVDTLGYQLGKDAQSCSPKQIKGLMKNVSLILSDIGIEYEPSSMASVLSSSFARREGAITDDNIATGDDAVYG
jgi:hypothetical protein